MHQTYRSLTWLIIRSKPSYTNQQNSSCISGVYVSHMYVVICSHHCVVSPCEYRTNSTHFTRIRTDAPPHCIRHALRQGADNEHLFDAVNHPARIIGMSIGAQRPFEVCVPSRSVHKCVCMRRSCLNKIWCRLEIMLFVLSHHAPGHYRSLTCDVLCPIWRPQVWTGDRSKLVDNKGFVILQLCSKTHTWHTEYPLERVCLCRTSVGSCRDLLVICLTHGSNLGGNRLLNS